MYKTDISVEIGSLKMKNPILPGSGCYGYFAENANCFPMSELGAVMVKTVFRTPHEGNPEPRLYELFGGMMNSVGIPSEGIEKFIATKLPKFETIGTQVVMSIAGATAQDYAESVELLDDIPYVNAIEMNLSCPNVRTGLPVSSSGQMYLDVLKATRQKTKKTLIAKLSPMITEITTVAKIAENEGMDAVTVANSYPSMVIDIEKKRPVFARKIAGFSGASIKPQTMRMVYQVYEAVRIPIIASGGVTCWQDAVEYVMAGAKAVEVGTINFADPMAMKDIVYGMDEFLSTHGYGSLEEIRGCAHEE